MQTEENITSTHKPSFDELPEMVFNLGKRFAKFEQLILTLIPEKKPIEDQELTIEQAGSRLHLKSRKSVMKLIHSQRLSAYKLSGSWRILDSEIERYKDQQRRRTNNSGCR